LMKAISSCAKLISLFLLKGFELPVLPIGQAQVRVCGVVAEGRALRARNRNVDSLASRTPRSRIRPLFGTWKHAAALRDLLAEPVSVDSGRQPSRPATDDDDVGGSSGCGFAGKSH
jgi:hypothetical protein